LLGDLGVGAAVVNAAWLVLDSMWVAPTVNSDGCNVTANDDDLHENRVLRAVGSVTGDTS
jgi:hypothetical protein